MTRQLSARLRFGWIVGREYRRIKIGDNGPCADCKVTERYVSHKREFVVALLFFKREEREDGGVVGVR